MITINAKEKEINIKIGFNKTKMFLAKNLKKEENIIEVLPIKAASFDPEFLVKLIVHFQDGTSFNEEQVGNILDEYFEIEEKDVLSLYTDIICEFDVMGVIRKGMGKKIANQILQAMDSFDTEINPKTE